MSIPRHVRDDVRQRITERPQASLAEAILTSLDDARVDLRQVTLEDIKRLLVVAADAAYRGRAVFN